MRNLRTISYEHVDVSGDLPLTATAWDTSNDSIICAFGPTPTQPVIELKRKVKLDIPEDHDGRLRTSKLLPITSWDAPCPIPDLPCDEILLMHFFSDTQTACLVLAGGDLVLVREEPPGDQERIEIVGSVDVGILAAAWAPDEELLAIVTRSDNLVLMSRDLEPVTETTMQAEDLQASRHVSVGWGKKETQFQGKRAKALRDPTMPEQVDQGLPNPYEDGKVNMSWRGDGAYLAVNAVVPNHRRAIRVYSREGVLDSVSEPIDGLDSALSWRPMGNLIATIKRSSTEADTKVEVVFLERNGLRHGEFSLRLSQQEVGELAKRISLNWNTDSTVLAVSFSGIVQYWTMGNYHYYLKQEVKLSERTDINPLCIRWHNEKPLKCIASTEDSLADTEYIFRINDGPAIKPFDYGVTCVIDGMILKLTPLKHAGVPPPMSFCEVTADSNIVDVAVSDNAQRVAILTRTHIEVCEWEMRSCGSSKQQTEVRHTTKIQKHKISICDSHSEQRANTFFTQIAFQGHDKVIIFAPAQREIRPACVRFNLAEVLTVGQVNITSTVPLTVPVTSQNMMADIYRRTTWIQSPESTSMVNSSSKNHVTTAISLSGGQANSAIFTLGHNTADGLTDPVETVYHKISLTTRGTLSANQRVLARDCTSFIVTDMHLIYTTSQHLLKFVHLTEPERMDVPADTPETDERCRSIERGAKIVSVMPSIYATVLQMPRGNLETIYPRVLVLTGIRESLRSLEYRTAFLACQNHQVDMNILHDYLPDVFMANIGTFVDSLKKPGRIDEFLSKLKEEDVTQTLYKDTLSKSADTNTASINGISYKPVADMASAMSKTGPEKVNSICDAIISILKTRTSKFLQCVITAHVCKRPPDLTSALNLISSLRQTSPDEADVAVSHLCFLTDTNRLFDAALALYDLELTLLVAQNAQRDPREYMPFLQNLQSLPLLRRQYQIDNHLRNYPKALTSLHALSAHEEVEAYTIKHSLFTHAMDLYKYTPDQLNNITLLYASYLASHSQSGAAATLYDSLGDYTSAYPLYALAHQWREALTCASLIPLDQSKLQSLALSLATTLTEESRDYRSAATIHAEYLADPTTSARLLCKSSYFAEATRVLSLHNLASAIPKIIDVALLEKFAEISELVADCRSQLLAQVPRILELRVKKAEDPLGFYGGDPAAVADGVDIPDNISLAPTDTSTLGGQSMFTRYGAGSKFAGTVASNASRKTSRTKRREERKRAKGKKGSVYEEEYLVGSVGRLIERINSVHEEVRRLVSGLLRRGMREQAGRVEEVMKEIEMACIKAKGEVWRAGNDDEKPAGDDSGALVDRVVETDGVGSQRPGGADGVFWDSQMEMSTAPGLRKDVPVVKGWVSNQLVSR